MESSSGTGVPVVILDRERTRKYVGGIGAVKTITGVSNELKPGVFKRRFVFVDGCEWRAWLDPGKDVRLALARENGA